ncbi:hypothetical protein J437_LFUL016235 [Ladona fulva]|uniref:Uncharacterized protein n=1 Tax=Ladona fulva TaxID=123851 RepID=A0A8K0KQH6_LADFU|nr:hypothetical protein J437_LFUL016235 [Ladona fulva]
MGYKTKNGLFALIFTISGFSCVFIAFVTPYWLENDGQHENPKFQRLGLWEVCLNDFDDVRHWYDTKFNGCMWIFEEEYYIIHDILLPGFFVATQFFFTLTFTILLLGMLMVALFMCCSRDHDRFVLLLLMIGSTHVTAAISGTIAVVTFGARGDGRDWMPNWEHNNMSWSYAFAVFGVMFLYAAGVLFLVEARRFKRRKDNEMATQAAYHMEQQHQRT